MDKAWRKKQYGWGIIFLAAVIVLASLFGTSVVVCAISGLALMLGTLQATAFIVWQHIQSSDRCSFHLSCSLSYPIILYFTADQTHIRAYTSPNYGLRIFSSIRFPILSLAAGLTPTLSLCAHIAIVKCLAFTLCAVQSRKWK